MIYYGILVVQSFSKCYKIVLVLYILFNMLII